MNRVSWDMYKSALQEFIPEEENIVIAFTPTVMFQKRGPLVQARKSAKRVLEDVAKKYKVDYKLLVRSLYENQ